jgi:protein-arginine kinase activator protein McsA
MICEHCKDLISGFISKKVFIKNRGYFIICNSCFEDMKEKNIIYHEMISQRWFIKKKYVKEVRKI